MFALTAPLVAQAQFVERTPAAIAATTASIGVVGDFDGDGDADVITVGYLPPVVYGFRRLVAGDLDGDGDVDFVGIPFTLGASVQVFVNDGTGAFTALQSWPTFTVPVGALAVADLDLDGDLDVLGVGAAGLFVWRNQGAMTFVDASASWSATVPAANFSSIVTGDLDGDGDVDAVLGGNTGVADLVLRNTGASFVVGVTLPVQADAATRSLLVDVDEDGDFDWLRGQVGVGLALNDGLGNLAFAPARVGPALGSSATLLAADFDRDVDVDLLIGEYLGAAQLLCNRRRSRRSACSGSISALRTRCRRRSCRRAAAWRRSRSRCPMCRR